MAIEDRQPNETLQATPVGAGLEVLRRESGMPELGRSKMTKTAAAGAANSV